MNCRAAHRLYVRADGSVPCNCDVGEHVTLYRPDRDRLDRIDYAGACFNGRPFRRMRERFDDGEMFLKSCADCYFFDPDAPFEHAGDAGRVSHVEDVQIESSFLCALDCAACVPKAIRRDPMRSPLGAGPYELPDAVFAKLVDDLHADGLTVGEFNFCGRGEPLLHPRFGELVAYARTKFPHALYSAVTGASLRYFPGVLEVDYLKVSIDGAYEESYAKYRKGGRLRTALDFVESVIAQRTPSDEPTSIEMPGFREHLRTTGRPRVQWKYLLFEHNDSDEEIRAAQALASEMGVDEMVFYLSHTWDRSKRFTTLEQIAADPLFQEFEGRRTFESNVNKRVENVAHWEKSRATQEAAKRDARRRT